MEVQLQDLLESIKKDGVENAKREADAILAKARAEGEALVASAKKEAQQLVEKAKADASQFEASARAAVSQAGRDVLITVQQGLQKSFDQIIQSAVRESFKGEAMADAIASVVKSFKINGELEIPEKLLADMEKLLKGRLGEELKKGIQLKPGRGFQGGFMLREEGGKAYYDFSDASIADVLKEHLSQQISELIRIEQ